MARIPPGAPGGRPSLVAVAERVRAEPAGARGRGDGRRRRRLRRDRRGRGLRGPLAPKDLPLALTRAERFDELVLTAVTRLERRWSEQLSAIEVDVVDVPDKAADAAGAAGATDDGEQPVPLGRSVAAEGGRPARIVVYRRPVEARTRGHRDRESLVHDVVVAQLAELLGLDPATVDPDEPER